eukprot:TRINITY_DN20072_c0_g2_i1.p1 TRINITY_DN20072_c0_g2~~TRINITY_DN20072_c0_g2_i1.p1  ORF type:complete len:531 (-),score=56.41 TRINITY_DN20072_c0_g2_i1:114-1502(-)
METAEETPFLDSMYLMNVAQLCDILEEDQKMDEALRKQLPNEPLPSQNTLLGSFHVNPRKRKASDFESPPQPVNTYASDPISFSFSPFMDTTPSSQTPGYTFEPPAFQQNFGISHPFDAPLSFGATQTSTAVAATSAEDGFFVNNEPNQGRALKRRRVMADLTFESLGDDIHMFDTETIDPKQFLKLSQPTEFQSLADQEKELADLLNDLYMLVYFVDMKDSRSLFVQQIALGTRELPARHIATTSTSSKIMITHELYERLPAAKKQFQLWIQVWSMRDSAMLLEKRSNSICLLRDGLRERPPVVPPDVCFFPQKVVIAHLKNCNSKATLSKRHKKIKLRQGNTWCRNPTACGEKGKGCSCQAYPSRIIKKGIRELKILLERAAVDPEVVSVAASLYTTLSRTADQQQKSIKDYGMFLQERTRRWKLYLQLKRFVNSNASNLTPAILDKFNFITNLIPTVPQ